MTLFLTSSVPRWVWGLAVGVPVAAALAYILFGPEAEGGEAKKVAKKKKKAAEVVKEEVKTEAPAPASEKVTDGNDQLSRR